MTKSKTISLREEIEDLVWKYNHDETISLEDAVDQIISVVLERIPERRVCSVEQNGESEYCEDIPYNQAIDETIKNIRGKEEYEGH